MTLFINESLLFINENHRYIKNDIYTKTKQMYQHCYNVPIDIEL